MIQQLGKSLATRCNPVLLESRSREATHGATENCLVTIIEYRHR